MHWGHATSADLVHWQEHGDVLAPDALGPMFSGSAVVDWHNTSGLGQDGRPPLVLIYTAAGNPTVQCLAHSTDGRQFTKFGGNPVVRQITPGNRDPKVCWHEPTKQWVMVLYVEREKVHTVEFLTSPNLRDWTPAGVAAGGAANDHYLYECPDFFALPVDGDAARRKWLLTAADSRYALGGFDGRTFTSGNGPAAGRAGSRLLCRSDVQRSGGRSPRADRLVPRPPRRACRSINCSRCRASSVCAARPRECDSAGRRSRAGSATGRPKPGRCAGRLSRRAGRAACRVHARQSRAGDVHRARGENRIRLKTARDRRPRATGPRLRWSTVGSAWSCMSIGRCSRFLPATA